MRTLPGPVQGADHPHQVTLTIDQHVPASLEATPAATTTLADLIIGACMRTDTPRQARSGR
jgi:hypothetical protein